MAEMIQYGWFSVGGGRLMAFRRKLAAALPLEVRTSRKRRGLNKQRELRDYKYKYMGNIRRTGIQSFKHKRVNR